MNNINQGGNDAQNQGQHNRRRIRINLVRGEPINENNIEMGAGEE
jgi:hypothetical protein